VIATTALLECCATRCGTPLGQDARAPASAAIGTVGSAIAAFALFFTSSLESILVVVFVFAAMSATTGPNVDALALVHLGDDQMHQYGRMRGWESLSYAASCLVFGFALELVGRDGRCRSTRAAILSSSGAPRSCRIGRRARSTSGASDGRRRVPRRPEFWVFLIALLLVWIGFNAAWNFISLKIEAAGWSAPVGIGTALGGSSRFRDAELFEARPPIRSAGVVRDRLLRLRPRLLVVGSHLEPNDRVPVEPCFEGSGSDSCSRRACS